MSDLKTILDLFISHSDKDLFIYPSIDPELGDYSINVSVLVTIKAPFYKTMTHSHSHFKIPIYSALSREDILEMLNHMKTVARAEHGKFERLKPVLVQLD